MLCHVVRWELHRLDSIGLPALPACACLAAPCCLQVYGVLLFQQGQADQARQVLRQGVGHNPGNPQLCMEWALAEQAAGNLGGGLVG